MEYAIKELPEVLFEFTGYLLEIRERLSTYKNVAFFTSVKAHKLWLNMIWGIIPQNE
jgi:hypothetical protein